jgi:replication-associated recombination protein RarA
MSELVPRKQHEKSLILEALELKQKLKGSVVMEFVRCGKHCSTCSSDGPGHGPYAYLHYFSDGKVKRKYLPRALGQLMSYSKEELREMLHDVDAEILGQERG